MSRACLFDFSLILPFRRKKNKSKWDQINFKKKKKSLFNSFLATQPPAPRPEAPSPLPRRPPWPRGAPRASSPQQPQPGGLRRSPPDSPRRGTCGHTHTRTVSDAGSHFTFCRSDARQGLPYLCSAITISSNMSGPGPGAAAAAMTPPEPSLSAAPRRAAGRERTASRWGRAREAHG